MLGDDTDLDDAALTSETAAAMRELASIVTDAPPLRLAPHRGTAPSRRRVRRRWAAWITPLAAAAAVIMLAITLRRCEVIRTVPWFPPPSRLQPPTACRRTTQSWLKSQATRTTPTRSRCGRP